MRQTLNSLLRRLGLDVARYPRAGTFAGELSRLLNATRPEVFLDVGAHRGESSSLVRALGFTGRIVAFEPDAACLPELRRRAEEDPAMEVVDEALGRTPGTATLFTMDCTGLASLRTPQRCLDGGSLRTMRVFGSTTVRVSTLQDVLNTTVADARSVFAKVDTQGSDLDVMEGAGVHRNRIVAAVLEAPLVHLYNGMASLGEILERMQAWGFATTGLSPVSRDRRGRVLEVDVFFLRCEPGPPRTGEGLPNEALLPRKWA